MTGSLAGKSILVVEDEIIIGMMLVKEIAGAGGAAMVRAALGTGRSRHRMQAAGD